MNILILTNQNYIEFIMRTIPCDFKDDVFLVKAFGEYDWSDEYDVGISFMYQYKVPADQVRLRPWFNFHPGPLPHYRGRDLCYHAIMNGEKSFGVSLHYMDKGFDTGDIISTRMFPIEDWWTAEELSGAAINQSKRLFEDYFPKILESPEFERLPNRGGTYYKKGKIIEEVPVRPSDPFGQFVRAVTYKEFYPRIDIGGVKYKIVREE